MTLISAFPRKLFYIVNDPFTNDLVQWSTSGISFIVWDIQRFQNEILPAYFKHGNFSSFLRQLNAYGFKKLNIDRQEFHHELFRYGGEELLADIKRKKSKKTNNSNLNSDIFKNNLNYPIINGNLNDQTIKISLDNVQSDLECTKRDLISYIKTTIKNSRNIVQALNSISEIKGKLQIQEEELNKLKSLVLEFMSRTISNGN